MRELQSIGACHSQSNKKRFSMCSAQASIGSKFRSFWSAIDRSGFQPVIALLLLERFSFRSGFDGGTSR